MAKKRGERKGTDNISAMNEKALREVIFFVVIASPDLKRSNLKTGFTISQFII